MAPSFLKPHEVDLWNQPWRVGLQSRDSEAFKRRLLANGYLSPHFTIAEAASKAGDSCGSPLERPSGDDLTRAQYHAFALERVRHVLGGKPLVPVSWYRSPRHNSCVGGVSNSQHMNGWATDWESTGDAFDNAFESQFAHGGRGYQGIVGGRIRHVDNGPERVWVY